MLMPKRVKYRKPQTAARIKGNECRATSVAFGDYGIKSTEPRWITARQIESARITISRFVRKKGRMWIRIFPDKAITKHPAETRMGKGKGAPEVWVAVVRPGRILFEVDGLTHDEAKEVMRLAGAKLPVKTKLVERR